MKAREFGETLGCVIALLVIFVAATLIMMLSVR